MDKILKPAGAGLYSLNKVYSSIGPKNETITVTNDGATILKVKLLFFVNKIVLVYAC